MLSLKRIFSQPKRFPPHSTTFDILITALSAWFIGGLFLDGWAHTHLDSSLETFFTPWHAVFYSGFAALAIALGSFWYKNVRTGFPYRSAVPEGYNPSLLGVVIFLAGGVGDLLWHTIFGIEANVDALLSPSHLVLTVGAFLIVTGPLRSVLYRARERLTGHELAPIFFSTAFGIMLLSFMSQYLSPLTNVWMGTARQTTDPFFGQALGIGGMVLQSIVFAGMALSVVRRRSVLPFGFFTVIITLHTIGFSFIRDQYRFIVPLIAAGIVLDFLRVSIQSRLYKDSVFRVLAFCVPFVYYLFYVGTVIATEGTWWSVHLWTGSFFVAGAAGLLTSYLVFPPESARD